jgi:hypothetical protein
LATISTLLSLHLFWENTLDGNGTSSARTKKSL